MKRFIVTILFFVCVLFLPWWLWFFMGVLFSFVLKDFFEFPIFALFSDLSFSGGVEIFNIPFFLSIVSFLLFLLIEFIRPNIRFSF